MSLSRPVSDSNLVNSYFASLGVRLRSKAVEITDGVKSVYNSLRVRNVSSLTVNNKKECSDNPRSENTEYSGSFESQPPDKRIETAGKETKGELGSASDKSSRRPERRQSESLFQRRKMTFVSPAKRTNSSFGCFLFLFTLLTLVFPVGGSTCIGTVVELRHSEALLACPLTTDVNQTKRNIAVQYLAAKDSFPEFPVTCIWEVDSRLNCKSQSHFEMLKLQPDRVLFKAPETSLKSSGSYRSQLVPPDEHKPFVHCDIYHFNESEVNSAATPTPGTLVMAAVTTAREHLAGKDTCLDQAGGLIVAVVALSCILLIQMLVIGFVTFFCFKKNQTILRGKEHHHKNDNKSDNSDVYLLQPSSCTSSLSSHSSSSGFSSC